MSNLEIVKPEAAETPEQQRVRIYKDEALTVMSYLKMKGTDWEKYNPAQLKRMEEEIQARVESRIAQEAFMKDAPLEMSGFYFSNMKSPDWIWKDRIAKKQLCVIGGLPGVGKSQFIAWLSSLVSNGGIWPMDGTKCKQGTVLLLSEEDEKDEGLAPRLIANCADLQHILKIDGVTLKDGEEVKILDLSLHLKMLERIIRTLPSLQVLIIDPISDYMGNINPNSNTEVRNFLNPLVRLARKYNFALICLTHLNKSNNVEAQSKMMGATAFTGVARTAYLVCKDPNDEARRYFVPIKNNHGNDKTGYVYTLKSKQLMKDINAPYVNFLDETVTLTASELLAQTASPERKSNLDAAKELLIELLKQGPQSSSAITKAAHEDGISPWFIKEARKSLKLKFRQKGFAKKQFKEWYLDGQDDSLVD